MSATQIAPACARTISAEMARPRPTPAPGPLGAPVRLAELLEHALLLAIGTPRAEVRDADRRERPGPRGTERGRDGARRVGRERRLEPHPDRDRPARRRELHRVVDEVDEDLRHAVGVALDDHGRLGGMSSSRRTSRSCASASSSAGRVAGERPEVVRADVVAHPAGLEPGEVEEVRDHRGEAAAPLQVEVEQASLPLVERAGQAVEEQAVGLLHRDQRGLELVRHVGHEAPLHPVELAEPAHHRVEVLGERGELVAPAGVELVGERRRSRPCGCPR